jgi:hypothetical protein
MRLMRVAAVLAGLALLGSPAVAAAAAKKKKKPKVDVKVVVLDTNFGDPAFVVVNPDGTLKDPIDIRIGVKNQGQHDSPPFNVTVFFQDSAKQHFQKIVRFPALKRNNHPHVVIVELTGKPHLGPAQVGAVADNEENLNDVDRANNFKKGDHFDVIARQWNANSFQTIGNVPGAAARTTQAGAGFNFQFTHYDSAKGQYVYQPMGSITSTSTYGGVCTGTGSLTVTHTPWAGWLYIGRDFAHYGALVQADPTKYPVMLTCLGGFTYNAMNGFDDLDTTQLGFATTNAEATTVTGDVPDPTTHLEWKWQFQAAGPPPAPGSSP